ncbi:hypothetical protein GE061_018727 [Apolygus lucorum]|uniref:Cyclin-dependent kinase 2-interacting protein n=1 Tax=Apolygus lucorum TaxID=248454 RepID=A0A6A4J708_APOLU|nr:hypothetical protein GE061_018727 [Apolygus lucorum]
MCFNVAENDENCSEELQKKFDLLMDIKKKLVEIVDGFKAINSHLLGLEKLERLNRNYDPLFLTWYIANFVELSGLVYESYRDQLNLNVHVVENLALVPRKSAGTLIALWLHQPCVDPIINFKVDSALKETGFS